MKTRCLIFNPVAKGERAKEFFEKLPELGEDWIFQKTQFQGDARRFAAEAVRGGCRVVVCAGGDGTVNEVVNGVGDVEDGFERSAIGVIPIGTSNVFAREHKIPLEPNEALKVISGERRKKIDLPYVEYKGNGRTGRRYFIQLGGAGLDARAVELVSWNLKKKIGWLAYIIAGLRAIYETQPEIYVESENFRASGNLVLFGNGKFFGGSFNVFPNAICDDGRLDLAIYPAVNYLTALRCISGLITKSFKGKGGVKYYQTSSFVLRSNKRVAFEVDGEFAGTLPIKVGVKPRGIEIIVP